ncbi:hypothetical protein EMIT0P291_250016 [Pseudomonas sp. IT-P291]
MIACYDSLNRPPDSYGSAIAEN